MESKACRYCSASERKRTRSKGLDTFYDRRNQSGKRCRYRNRDGRKNLPQRNFGECAGDSGSSCSKWYPEEQVKDGEK